MSPPKTQRRLLAAEQRGITGYERHAYAYKTGLGEQWKVSHGVPLNIYDAAKSYRTKQGLTGTPIREILHDERFRNAWGTFKGGYKWQRTEATRWALEKDYKKKGGIYSTTKQKLAAAEILGWHEDDNAAFERLRIMSP